MSNLLRCCAALAKLFAAAILCLSAVSLVAADEAALQAARREYAMHFFSAEAHVRLAKAQYDGGDRLQAFYTLETARRQHFPQDEFDRAFRRVFRHEEFDNSPAAEAALSARLAKSPADYALLTKLADVYISRGDFDKAVPLLERAGRARPDDYEPVEALAEIYRRTGRDSKANATEWLWLNAHPDSIEAYASQIDKAQPARALALANEAVQRYPNSAVLHYDRAAVLHRANDVQGAEAEFTTAEKLAPDSALIQGWMARFYLKTRSDPRRAFEHYLNAYFLDPDFYDSEYAEQRILKLADQLTEQALDAGPASGDKGDPIRPLLRPCAIGKLLEAERSNWEPESFPHLVDTLYDDDETNRWNAMRLIADHADAAFDAQLTQLLQDPDLRARGMAGYIAVKRWHERAFPALRKALDDPAVLVRFDAISALAMDGGPAGRQVVRDYAAAGREPDPHLRDIIPKILAEQEQGK